MASTKFPTPPYKQRDSMAFPNDLIQSNRKFYTQISFVDYKTGMMGSTIKLPIPKRLNDNEFNLWQEYSMRDKALGVAASVASRLPYGGSLVAAADFLSQPVSTHTGLTVNPFMFMMYQRPQFKEHQFTWTLAPSNKKESDTIKKIVNTFKKSALPTPEASGFLMKYPKTAIVRFMPDDNYLYKIKPCAIISVQVDYNGSNIPSFFNSGAPTVVNLTIQLKETELWNTDNYEPKGI